MAISREVLLSEAGSTVIDALMGDGTRSLSGDEENIYGTLLINSALGVLLNNGTFLQTQEGKDLLTQGHQTKVKLSSQNGESWDFDFTLDVLNQSLSLKKGDESLNIEVNSQTKEASIVINSAGIPYKNQVDSLKRASILIGNFKRDLQKI